MDKKTFAEIRRDYIFDKKTELMEEDISTDPIKQFEEWFKDALMAVEVEANAMTLATSTKNGRPSLRTVLLKDFDKDGFVFFTNYSSRKGKELKENPFASMLFFWKELGRQVRIEGKIEKISRDMSEEYFHSRPRDSQIAALASLQSSVIEDRNIIEKKFQRIKEEYKDKIIPLPEIWGGYILIPYEIEFWQGRQNRMHDRILYTKTEDGWKTERLSP